MHGKPIDTEIDGYVTSNFGGDLEVDIDDKEQIYSGYGD